MKFDELYYYVSATFGFSPLSQNIYAFALIAYLPAWEALNNERQEAELTFPYTKPLHH